MDEVFRKATGNWPVYTVHCPECGYSERVSLYNLAQCMRDESTDSNTAMNMVANNLNLVDVVCPECGTETPLGEAVKISTGSIEFKRNVKGNTEVTVHEDDQRIR